MRYIPRVLLHLAVLTVASISWSHVAEAKRPNIIVLLGDDLGYGDLSCFAHPAIHSPNLDRLASQGMKLTHCYSSSPEAQRRVLPVFHYARRPGGLLFLGPSETIGGFADWFENIDGKWKIYRRKEALRQRLESICRENTSFGDFLLEG